MAGKAGAHKFGSYEVTIAEDGAIKVKKGDWLSKYSAAIYSGNVTRVNEYARMTNGELVPIEDVDLIITGETIYHIPTHVLAVEAKQPKSSPLLRNVWLGVGGQSGARAIGGPDSLLATLYNLGDPINAVRHVELYIDGASIGLGAAVSIGTVAAFGYGISTVGEFNAVKGPSWDFDFSPGQKLGPWLKKLKLLKKLGDIGKILDKAEKVAKFKKLRYVGEQLVKSRAFVDPDVYTLPIPGAGWSLGIWLGKRAHERKVIHSGVMNFTV